jgi:hypothetical protein
MADGFSKRGEPDRSRISLDEEYEVRYWTERFDVSKSELKAAVAAVGRNASEVLSYLIQKEAG